MSPLAVRVCRSPGVLSRKVGGEVLLGAPGRNGFDQLSESAGIVWGLLDVPRTDDEIVAILAHVYGEPPEAIAADVDGLLADLLRRGWIEEVQRL